MGTLTLIQGKTGAYDYKPFRRKTLIIFGRICIALPIILFLLAPYKLANYETLASAIFLFCPSMSLLYVFVKKYSYIKALVSGFILEPLKIIMTCVATTITFITIVLLSYFIGHLYLLFLPFIWLTSLLGLLAFNKDKSYRQNLYASRCSLIKIFLMSCLLFAMPVILELIL